MKLVPLLVAATLALSLDGAARADNYDSSVDPYGAPQPPRQRAAGRHQQMPALRRMVIARFDRNGDGRLEPRERRQAVRALRRLERRLAKQGGRGGRMPGLIRKYDLDGDGNVGPGEMPPAMAKRLRRLDRDGNGWVDADDFRDQ